MVSTSLADNDVLQLLKPTRGQCIYSQNARRNVNRQRDISRINDQTPKHKTSTDTYPISNARAEKPPPFRLSHLRRIELKLNRPFIGLTPYQHINNPPNHHTPKHHHSPKLCLLNPYKTAPSNLEPQIQQINARKHPILNRPIANPILRRGRTSSTFPKPKLSIDKHRKLQTTNKRRAFDKSSHHVTLTFAPSPDYLSDNCDRSC